MSFFSRKKQATNNQSAPSVTVAQPPSQALAQLSKDPQAQQQQQLQQQQLQQQQPGRDVLDP
jgi:hypothetical protein